MLQEIEETIHLTVNCASSLWGIEAGIVGVSEDTM
jgi:hypothetical protein